MGKRGVSNNTNLAKPFRRKVSDHDWDGKRIGAQLLVESKHQNKLLQTVLDKLSNYFDINSATTTEDWNYIQPYLKQETSENVDKKELIHDYYGDD